MGGGRGGSRDGGGMEKGDDWMCKETEEKYPLPLLPPLHICARAMNFCCSTHFSSVKFSYMYVC